MRTHARPIDTLQVSLYSLNAVQQAPTTGDTELGVNGEHQNLIHEASSVTSRKQIEPSTKWVLLGLIFQDLFWSGSTSSRVWMS